MSFGDKRLDRVLDNWIEQTPEDYFGEEEEPEEIEKPKEPTADELLAQGLCPYCKEKLTGFLMGHLKNCETFKKELGEKRWQK